MGSHLHSFALSLLALLLLVAPARADDTDRDLSGTYQITEGVGLDKGRYSGSVTFAGRRGGPVDGVPAPYLYDITWTVGDDSIQGLAMHAGSRVLVGWGESFELGYYDATPIKKATLLMPHSTSAAVPWSWNATIKKRKKDGWSGRYKFSDGAKKTWGSLTIKRHKSKWRFDLAWKDKKKKGKAIAVPLLGTWQLGVVSGKRGFGAVVYDISGDVMTGRWVVDGVKGEGREVIQLDGGPDSKWPKRF